MGEATLISLASEAKDWLFENAAPLWLAHRSPVSDLFAESLTIDGKPTNAPQRVLVQARQIYSCCEIGRLGWKGDWEAPTESAINYLVANGRRADGFYIHRFNAQGGILEAEANLYDQAFMLLALAHAGRALERPDLFAEAHRLTDLIEAKWRHPAGGFINGDNNSGPRLQNPHMHMLEAFNALHNCTGEARWEPLAKELARLGETCFMDRQSGALLEYFEKDLSPLHGLEGKRVEPGHCFEWSWLFEQLAAQDPRWGMLSDRLTSFARRFGIDALRGVAINEVLTDGTPHNPNARLWPQAERLKAALARLRRTSDPAEAEEAVHAYHGLKRYLATPTQGTWHDKLQSDGAWIDEPSPGSSLYHITCALSELFAAANS